MANHSKQVVVALSGGVDSAVAAWLLKRDGFAVRAVFMHNWEDDEHCPAREAAAAAAAAAEVIGVDLEMMNFAADYKRRVFAGFLRELRRGRTPNPDVWCNSEIKFGAFLDAVVRQTPEAKIATGHYARIRVHPGGGARELLRGEDSAKDQSYFLYRLNQAQLAKTLFPLGGMTKAEVRRTARAAGLPNAERPDSTGICFVGERDFRAFARRYLPRNPGPIQTPQGEVVGEHDGVAFYTIGQRHGLGLGGEGRPWFVADKKIKENILIVVRGADDPLLFRARVAVADAHWIAGKPPNAEWVYAARIRHRQTPASCTLTEVSATGAEIAFAAPQAAAAPGQSAVVYDGNVCLGGGIIE